MRNTLRQTLIGLLAIGMLAALPGIASADHPAPGITESFAGASTNANQGGVDGASFEILASFPAGNSFTDHEFFSQGGDIFASVGTLGGGGLNLAGQTIVKITEGGPPSAGGEISPSYQGAFPSATCPTDFSGALGLQHDVEASPKGITLLNETNPFADRSDTQLILDASDAPGRCHDQGTLGLAGVPRGGVEFVDVTDPTAPVELALTSHIGQAHTVNVDPKRPHIAYIVTSDGVSVTDLHDPDDDTTPAADAPVDERYLRQNEDPADSDRFDLDGWEMVDFSSCLDLPAEMSVEDKRTTCQPETYRYRYPSVEVSLGHTNTGTVYGCHELEVYPDDRLACGAGGALILFDVSGAFDDNGTPADFSDDTINGEALDCRPRASTTDGPTATEATVHDCVQGGTDDAITDLTVAAWLADGAPGVDGVEWLGSAYHMGRESTDGAASPAFASDADIDFDHEAEFTHSGNFLLATDERGGGVVPPGASCTRGMDNPAGNGGVHAYAVDRLKTERPASPDEAFETYALTSEGEKAIYRTSIQTSGEAAFCTAHVLQQIPGQNRIFMAWYSQGTRVVDYVENEDGTLDFFEIAYFIPENTDQWASEVFDVVENDDGSFTYYGLSAETLEGRGTIDIFQADLPAPMQLAPEVPITPPTTPPTTPSGVDIERVNASGAINVANAVSRDAYPAGADSVVLGRVDTYADNLAGGPLATKEEAPLLYTQTATLNPDTAAEINRLDPQTVFILGGVAAVSQAVEDELEADGRTVVRFGGANRFDTAGLIAERVGSATGTAYVVEGENADAARGWPDPLSVAPLAGYNGDPILLVNRDRLPDETITALSDLGVTDVIIGGGTAAVSVEVADGLADQIDGAVTRLSGANRFETSLQVYNAQVAAGMDPAVLTLAVGSDWPNALAAGPVSAIRGTTFAIVDGQGGADTLEALIQANLDRLLTVRLIGDETVINAAVEADVEAAAASDEDESMTQAAAFAGPSGGDLGLLIGLALLIGLSLTVRRRRHVLED